MREGFRFGRAPLVAATALLGGALLMVASASAAPSAPMPAGLRAAIRSGDLVKVGALVAPSGAVNSRDSEGMTPLHYASFVGQLPVAQLLVAKGADVNAADGIGMTPLHAAAFEGRDTVVRFLLSKGASPNPTDSAGMTPLHYAAAGGHREAMKALLEKGAGLNARDKKGRTPLDMALLQRQLGTAQDLRTAGAATGAASASRSYTDDDLTRLRGGDSMLMDGAPPLPPPPRPGQDYGAAQLEQFQRYMDETALRLRNLEASLPALSARCEQARANEPRVTETGVTVQESSGSTMPGSYSRQDEWRTHQASAQACGEYERALQQAQYYKQSLENYRRLVDDYRARAGR